MSNPAPWTPERERGIKSIMAFLHVHGMSKSVDDLASLLAERERLDRENAKLRAMPVATALEIASPLLTRWQEERDRLERERDEANAYAAGRLAERDRMEQQLEHRTLTLGAAVKRAEQAERDLAVLRERAKGAVTRAWLDEFVVKMKKLGDEYGPTNAFGRGLWQTAENLQLLLQKSDEQDAPGTETED